MILELGMSFRRELFRLGMLGIDSIVVGSIELVHFVYIVG